MKLALTSSLALLLHLCSALLEQQTTHEYERNTQTNNYLTERLDGVNKLLEERYESAWKTRKDGKARYRKVATKVLVNAWVTESEPIEKKTVMMDVDWSTLEEERNDLRMLYHQ